MNEGQRLYIALRGNDCLRTPTCQNRAPRCKNAPRDIISAGWFLTCRRVLLACSLGHVTSVHGNETAEWPRSLFFRAVRATPCLDTESVCHSRVHLAVEGASGPQAEVGHVTPGLLRMLR